MEIRNMLDDLEETINRIRTDVDKFEINSNNLAGTRIRKAMQSIKVKAQEVRVAITEIKNKRKEEK